MRSCDFKLNFQVFCLFCIKQECYKNKKNVSLRLKMWPDVSLAIFIHAPGHSFFCEERESPRPRWSGSGWPTCSQSGYPRYWRDLTTDNTAVCFEHELVTAELPAGYCRLYKMFPTKSFKYSNIIVKIYKNKYLAFWPDLNLFRFALSEGACAEARPGQTSYRLQSNLTPVCGGWV